MKIRIFDTASGFTGYSRNISGIAIALADLGVDVKVIQPATTDYIPDKLKPILEHDFDKAIKEIDNQTIVMGRTFQGIEQFRRFNPMMICSILVLEGDRIPEDWVLRANLCDQIWASSEYNKEMLVKNGVASDIAVIHHGFDESMYWNKWDMQDECGEPKEIGQPFRFLFVGGHTNPMDRKGGQFAAQAFNIFEPTDNVELVFKINTSYMPDYDSEANLRSMIKPELQDKVTIITKFMTEEELADLYRSADVSVTPSMGEAFCQSILESMACGTPVIVTDWSGYLDYTQPALQYHIPIEKRIVAHYGQFDVTSGSVWVVPDIEWLRKMMKIISERKFDVEELGREAAKYVHKEMIWKKQAEKTIKAIEAYNNNIKAQNNQNSLL